MVDISKVKIDKNKEAYKLEIIAKKIMIHAGLCDDLGLEY